MCSSHINFVRGSKACNSDQKEISKERFLKKKFSKENIDQDRKFCEGMCWNMFLARKGKVVRK
jgi:hypothetical protein